MGCGVLGYFALRAEPPLWLGLTFASVTTVGWLGLPAARVLWAPALFAALGFTAGQFATIRAAPMESDLPTRATIITGIVRSVEVLPEGRRITFEPAWLDDAPSPRQRAIRVRLRKGDTLPAATGDRLRVRALIRPPAAPAYPGAWDLQRDAFFTGLGASGYAIGPIESLAQAVPSAPAAALQRLRETVARHITDAIPGAAGTICVTLMTGGQSSIPAAEHAAFRDSGLAHLLAVAGLHIGIVMGYTMGLARLILACSTRASLFWPTKAIAACTALLAGGGYMLLTGMHVPIVRSFLMACLVTIGIVTGRRVVSLRALGLAGVGLMLAEPWEVPGVSFQMSFSAVLALIAGYEVMRPWLRSLHGKSWPRRVASHVVALALTSALAGTASAPYGAYHFGHIQTWFVVANMVAVPLTAVWVMPAGLIALLLMPFGLDWLALIPMGWGAQAVIWVGQTVSAWPYATFDVPHSPAWGLMTVSLGLAWLGLWRSRVRLGGIVLIGLGLASPALVRPPDILVSADARLIGFRAQSAIYLQQNQGGSRFVRDAWVQYWGNVPVLPFPPGPSADAVSCEADACRLNPGGLHRAALLVTGPAKPAECQGIDVVVSAEPARGLCPRPWPRVVDRFTVWREGAVAIWLTDAGADILTDRSARGSRPWVPGPPPPRAKTSPILPRATLDEGMTVNSSPLVDDPK